MITRRLSLLLLASAALAAAALAYPAARGWLFDVTGEESLAAQVRGLGHLASDLLRPPLDLQAEVPIAHNGVNPYGINTFLQQEVEPAKRARQLDLIAAAGFHWLRQEFPWYDLEISGRGNFEDCRFPPCVSAWDKYDQIVGLAEARGLEFIARLSAPPAWARAAGTARGDFAPPDNFTDFANYAAAVAEHYRGRIRYYQVWNEPNIYPEWGNQPVDPEAYTRLLCETYARLKAVDPNIVVLSGVLAPTAELGAYNDLGATNLNEYIFLERMYQAGAGACFDVLSVQGYGLWSGPTDRRLRPLTINYGRNQFLRDLMVRHGDAGKAIWIAEMNWNTVPAGSGIAPNYGQMTEEQQARYAPLAYQRAQSEWPWVGAVAFWFFKRADDSEKNQAWYYFRMAEPDFTLLPVYASLQNAMRQPPKMYPGWFQEDHWAVRWQGWSTRRDPAFTLGAAHQADQAGTSLSFTFDGTDLWLEARRGPHAGRLSARVDGGAAQVYDLNAPEAGALKLHLARARTAGAHTLQISALDGGEQIDGFIVRRAPNLTPVFSAVLVLGLAAVWLFVRRPAA